MGFKRCCPGFFIIFMFFMSGAVQASEDSSRLQVSLITCDPGAELYSVFGHTALRIVDTASGTDIAYNFGTFNFDDPDFYSKFVRGKLMYFLSQQSFQDFLYEYDYFKRGVREQVLHFPGNEKENIQQALFENLRDENRYYKYDFFYDNCATRLRDIIFRSNKDSLATPAVIEHEGKTFRDYLHNYLSRAKMSWTTLGIDLLLGVGADKKMGVAASMFLPDYLSRGIASSNTDLGKLVEKDIVHLSNIQPTPEKLPFWQEPLFFFLFLSFLVILPSFFRTNRMQAFQLVMDKFIYLVSGSLGLILLFMWFGTDHLSFANNLNLVWAMPLNVVAAFAIGKEGKAWQWYFKAFSLLLLFFCVVVMLQPDMINFSVYPLIAVLSFRSWIHGRAEKNVKALVKADSSVGNLAYEKTKG